MAFMKSGIGAALLGLGNVRSQVLQDIQLISVFIARTQCYDLQRRSR